MKLRLLFLMLLQCSLIWAGTNNSTVDVKNIRLDLKFDWAKKQAYGSAIITLIPKTTDGKIFLDAGHLSINSIILEKDNSSVQYKYDGGDKDSGLEISLGQNFSQKEVSIRINYHTNYVNHSDPNNIWGSFGKGFRFFEPTSTTPKKNKQIWSSGEPEGNKYWFPCNEDLVDVRTTELFATIEEPLMVISNGNLVEIKTNNNNTRTFHYRAANPYPNFLTSIVIGEYTEIINMSNGKKLSTFCYPHEKEAAEATIERLPDMFGYFENLLGFPYPYQQYSQVVVQDYPFPGLSGQHSMSIVSDNFIDDYRTHADFLYLWDGVEAQSLSSQWFGNLIMPKKWSEIWLNRGFTHYLDGLYNDYKNGHAEYLIYYHNTDMNSTLSDWKSGYRHPIVTDNYENLETFTSDNYAKARSALVLRMLQKQVGDEKWGKILKKYIKDNAGKQVTTTDFKKTVENVTGENMDWFFQQWFYNMGHPVFEVSKNFNPMSKQLSITVKQVQQQDEKATYPQNKFYKGNIEIEINDKIKTVNLEAKAINTFVFNVPENPALVNFDFENTWIKEVTFSKTFDELVHQAKYDKDILGKWEAILKLTEMANSKTAPSAEKEKIYHTFREIILSNAYWRLRGNTLFQLRTLLKAPYDKPTTDMLEKLIENDKPWVKTGAITFLGMTNDRKFAPIYLRALNDKSDRVINAAATALGKTKAPEAFEILIKLADKPSWKSQSLISSLNGLKELGNPNATEFALKAISDNTQPRWFLATPVWDYPIAAAETLVALKKENLAYPVIFERFKTSMNENDLNDIFSNVLLITKLADARGKEVFEILNEKFKNDANAMLAVKQFESQFNENLTKK